MIMSANGNPPTKIHNETFADYGKDILSKIKL